MRRTTPYRWEIERYIKKDVAQVREEFLEKLFQHSRATKTPKYVLGNKINHLQENWKVRHWKH